MEYRKQEYLYIDSEASMGPELERAKGRAHVPTSVCWPEVEGGHRSRVCPQQRTSLAGVPASTSWGAYRRLDLCRVPSSSPLSCSSARAGWDRNRTPTPTPTPTPQTHHTHTLTPMATGQHPHPAATPSPPPRPPSQPIRRPAHIFPTPLPSPVLASYAEHIFYARRPLPDTSLKAAHHHPIAMPRPHPPPTPGSSSDLRGREGSFVAPTVSLPPAAYQDQDRASSSSTPSANGSDSSYRPVSPTSPADLARKRTAHQAGGVITKDDFALPPPPTRSRKIIQMKPRENESQEQFSASATASPQVVGKTPSAAPQAGKRKQANSGTTAAGRKIARKTAHSLIERRRRSKMNEEFGVLKEMIPACKGQEMHKLAILQAQNHSPHSQALPAAPARATQDDEDEDEDEEMEDDTHGDAGTSTPATAGLEPSNSRVSLPSLSQITTTSTNTNSPSVFSAGAGRHYSISSTSQASYSPYFHSNQTSPAFGPQLTHVGNAPSYGNFGLGSPALKPVDSAHHLRQIAEGATELSEKQRSALKSGASAGGRSEKDLDHEATAALLMLNNDRRNWRTGQDSESMRTSTGMSTKPSGPSARWDPAPCFGKPDDARDLRWEWRAFGLQCSIQPPDGNYPVSFGTVERCGRQHGRKAARPRFQRCLREGREPGEERRYGKRVYACNVHMRGKALNEMPWRLKCAQTSSSFSFRRSPFSLLRTRAGEWRSL
nr:hypothetical protein CFP56_01196 [Quercus suber]